jgi:hypothetical protein
MVPLALLYAGGVIGDWLRLVVLVYTTIANSVSRVKRKHDSRPP